MASRTSRDLQSLQDGEPHTGPDISLVENDTFTVRLSLPHIGVFTYAEQSKADQDTGVVFN